MDRFEDNIIRKANQRLARLQKDGFENSYEVRQLYLASLRGNTDIVVNKKGQLQFKRTSNLSKESHKMIDKIVTNTNYTQKGFKLKYKDLLKTGQGLTGLPVEEVNRRIMATFDQVKNKFFYTDALSVIDTLEDIDNDRDRLKKLKEVEKFLNDKKIQDKYKYADDLYKALKKNVLDKKILSPSDYTTTNSIEELYKGL